MKTPRLLIAALALLAVFSSTFALAQQSGTITGFIEDLQTGCALPGANLTLFRTGRGTSTNAEGRYIIHNIPPGSYTLRAKYVGYRQREVAVQVMEGQTLRQDLKLLAVGVEGEEVVVTAQSAGQAARQKAAMNQQISAMAIMNIVSRARIQELPDANAVESVSRLPGVLLIRTGGEGSRLIVRGLSPQYNQVTIDGVELPSNVISTNNITFGGGTLESTGDLIGDRAGDLSMISSSMLSGIEMTKAITPDMDAAVLGGVVNFGLRKANKTTGTTQERRGAAAPMIELRMQGGYAGLKQNYDNYRIVASVEKRFSDDQRFGLFIQGMDEKRNLSTNNLAAEYTLYTKLPPPNSDMLYPEITGLTLTDVFRKRHRYGGTTVLDYQHEQGEIALLNYVGVQTTQEFTRGERLQPKTNDLLYTANEANNKLTVISNLLDIKHDLAIVQADLKLSHSYSESSNPEDLYFDFWQVSPVFSSLGNLTKIDPRVLASRVIHDQANAGLRIIKTSGAISRERTLQGSLDLTREISISPELSSRLKIGGMFQHRTRDFDCSVASGWQWYSGGYAVVNAIRRAFPWVQLNRGGGANAEIGMDNFTTDSYQYGEFLNGDYALAYPINVNIMWDWLPVAKATPTIEGYQVNTLGSVINDYTGWENKSAGYAMVVADYGHGLSFIPGLRFQNLTTNYSAMRGTVTAGDRLQGGDTTVQHSNGFWLPMVHARYRPCEWLQFHGAYTKTLNYPDYSILTPRYLISTGYIDYNDHTLRPATSENFDLVISFISNEIGLLSLNEFKKRIRDLVFFTHTYTADLSKYPELPQGGHQLFTVNTYINNPIPIDLYGIETEWQTHFWYLPKPFDGLVLNVNYTHIFSEAHYPRTVITTAYDDEGNMIQTLTDTSYSSRMLNQPSEIVNLVLGYDLGGFSLRLSFLYQDDIFRRPDFWLQQRVQSAKFARWDIAVRQVLPWLGMEFYFNMNNIAGEDEVDLNQKNMYPASQERYGMSANVGVVVHLRYVSNRQLIGESRPIAVELSEPSFGSAYGDPTLQDDSRM